MRALKVCSVVGCPELVATGRCDPHRAEAEARRGTSQARGYGRQHAERFRRGVLAREPLCVCTTTEHRHGSPCLAPASIADHHPLSRRELVDAQLDPNDPQHGRGLCGSCHSTETAHDQPGGWNR